MRIDVLTIFPNMFQGPLQESILKKAQEKGIITVNTVDIRSFSEDKHKRVDDYPFGGGVGMVMKPEPIFAAWEAVHGSVPSAKTRTILLCPQGEVFSQRKAEELAELDHLILICGHYEGVDERVRDHLVDEELSIGDYILTGGELPAMVVIDAVARLLPGVLGTYSSAEQDSFSDGLLEYPQYTRPREFRGWQVPEVLLSGNHRQISIWRRQQSLLRTKKRRPDLLKSAQLSAEDLELLNKTE
ncbi:tRNA (guanosine(37)-N1)-methyltransferase TrmD [Zhaonella formicivorans]|uniref:tRNA (guanosine(37)-N1)-methyltransferase TrmD n=1 Tax=Zhaonella formicivorans TaxID=2528593 RepID=UPI0010EB59CD|nr:tRNA (guanosine(37)-N1)-methyltransferase TrmD [Zhaonella formicivorans]